MSNHSLLAFCRRHWRGFMLLPAVAIAQTEPSVPAPTPSQVVAPPQVIRAPQVVVASGFDYSRGDYGLAASTEIFAVPVRVSYENDEWTLQVSQSWLRVQGPAVVVLDGAQVGGAVGRPVSSRESGSGDLNVGFTYRTNPTGDRLNVAYTGRIKFGTANENRGLGTGKTDYYAQVDFTRPFGTTVPFLSVGYRFLGSNARYPLRDGAYLSGGFVRHLTGATQVGLELDWRERIVAGGDNGSELTGFVTHRLDDRWSLQGYALVGLTNASPDFGCGSLVSYRF